MTRPARALALAACTLVACALAVSSATTLDAQDTRRGGNARGAVTRPGARAPRAASAESSAAAARALVAQSALDAWIVAGFRGAALLPADTLRDSTARSASLPRVESVRLGRGADTLYALHFDARSGPPAARAGATVRLVGPTGTRTEIVTRVIASREFRAPATPGASARTRFAWAYLVLIPRPTSPASGASSALAYRGWLLAPVETR